MLRLIGDIMLTILLVGLVVLVQRRFNPYREEAFAPEPPIERLDCRCPNGGVTYTCMRCQHTRCGDHRDVAHLCPDRDGDFIPDEDTIALIAGTPAVVVAAGPPSVAEQFAEITAAMPELDLCDGLAIFYLRPEVTQ
jgi:hypothetical protein